MGDPDDHREDQAEPQDVRDEPETPEDEEQNERQDDQHGRGVPVRWMSNQVGKGKDFA